MGIPHDLLERETKGRILSSVVPRVNHRSRRLESLPTSTESAARLHHVGYAISLKKRGDA